jgi:allantoinase
MDDDLPYYVRVLGKPWLVLPYSMEVNDARFWRGGLPGFGL